MDRKETEDKLEMVQIRLVPDGTLISPRKMRGPMDAVDVLVEELKYYDKEVMCVLNLDSTPRPINVNFVSMGTVNHTLAMPGEMFKSAILSNASYMMLIHNHPSGDVTASKDDIAITKRMDLCCRMMGIPLIDSLIIGGRTGFVSSLYQLGYVEKSNNIDLEEFRREMFGEEAKDNKKDIKYYGEVRENFAQYDASLNEPTLERFGEQDLDLEIE